MSKSLSKRNSASEKRPSIFAEGGGSNSKPNLLLQNVNDNHNATEETKSGSHYSGKGDGLLMKEEDNTLTK